MLYFTEIKVREIALRTVNSFIPLVMNISDTSVALEDLNNYTTDEIQKCNEMESTDLITDCILVLLPEISDKRTEISNTFTEQMEAYNNLYNMSLEQVPKDVEEALKEAKDCTEPCTE